ncbi:MAG: PEP-CTERM sorting domain-containing protein [Prosthecobacter sp.]|nr:PEP-CTERM sorting domain-containing protein [Prosthecobacter sp.]
MVNVAADTLRPSPAKLLVWLVCASALLAETARAIILVDTPNPLTNTTAPTGIYADSGWDFLGEYGSSLGTMIAPQYFITAQHTGLQGSTFVSTAELNGSADVTYTIDTAANGGTGYWDIAGTDLRILKINETFSAYVGLYAGGAEIGAEMVTFGRGGPRGADVVQSAELKGWQYNASDGVFRWGTNVISAVVPSGVGSLLSASFDAGGGVNEATLSSGDSGGGVFILDGGQWKLAGVNFGVDGWFDFNDVVDSGEFEAALFDMGGLYIGNDSDGWTLVPDGAVDVPSHLYASRIADNAAVIDSIVGVPEPGGLWVLFLAAVTTVSVRRRPGARRKSARRC